MLQTKTTIFANSHSKQFNLISKRLIKANKRIKIRKFMLKRLINFHKQTRIERCNKALLKEKERERIFARL
jgi:hypothetical protein